MSIARYVWVVEGCETSGKSWWPTAMCDLNKNSLQEYVTEMNSRQERAVKYRIAKYSRDQVKGPA